MKYELSVDAQQYMPLELKSIKWEEWHYPPNSTEVERAEIDELVNKEIRGKKSVNLGGVSYDVILDQVNIDRQIESIKKSGKPGLFWYVRVKRVEETKLIEETK